MLIHSLDELISFIKERKKIILDPYDISLVNQARKVFEGLMRTEDIYGVNLGVGALLGNKISDADQENFQKNLILSHAAGSGPPIEEDVAKGMMLLLINTLRKGNSGISLETLSALVDAFNKNAIPFIPNTGSLGASGDLIPLAHLALFLTKERGIKLNPGEAIFLINGTHFCTSLLSFVVYEAEKLNKISDLTTAMTIEALNANSETFHNQMSFYKEHVDARISESNLSFLTTKRDGEKSLPVQEAYSLRCSPQVHGACRNALDYARRIAEAEINSISLNPIVDVDNRKILLSGNFHAQEIAFAADLLGISLTTLANISERRTNRLLNSNLSNGLPAFLSPVPGVDSGFMIAQYEAAALIARNKILANPASVNSVPVSADQEDFVSMAATAVVKAKEILENTQRILAIELLCAASALKFRKQLKHVSVAQAMGLVLGKVSSKYNKKPMADLIKEVFDLIKTESILKGLNLS